MEANAAGRAINVLAANDFYESLKTRFFFFSFFLIWQKQDKRKEKTEGHLQL